MIQNTLKLGRDRGPKEELVSFYWASVDFVYNWNGRSIYLNKRFEEDDYLVLANQTLAGKINKILSALISLIIFSKAKSANLRSASKYLKF